MNNIKSPTKGQKTTRPDDVLDRRNEALKNKNKIET
jgi:hypothetical protein